MQAPVAWQGKGRGRGFAFGIDPGVVGQPLAFFEQRADTRQQVLVERRVEEHQIEGGGRLGFQVAQGVGGLYLADGAAQRPQVLAQVGHGNVAGIQCLAHGGATGSRTLAPATYGASQLNKVSRTRSGVGRNPGTSGKLKRRLRHSPPMMRSLFTPLCGWAGFLLGRDGLAISAPEPRAVARRVCQSAAATAFAVPWGLR